MSPKLSPEELRKAKEKKKQEMEDMEKEESERKRKRALLQLKWEQISSELNGLYDELDKINKKAHEEPVSDLTLNNVNNLIQDTKEIIKNDPYIDRIKAFVAAGDNPQYRDVVMVLRQLRQGLNRFKEAYFPDRESLSGLIDELDLEDL